MTRDEGKWLLAAAIRNDEPWKANSAITRRQAAEIVERGIDGARAVLEDGITLVPLYEKRVLQVCRNQKRPKTK